MTRGCWASLESRPTQGQSQTKWTIETIPQIEAYLQSLPGRVNTVCLARMPDVRGSCNFSQENLWERVFLSIIMCYYQRHSIKDTPVIDMATGFKRKSDINLNVRIFNINCPGRLQKKINGFSLTCSSGKGRRSQKTLSLVAPETYRHCFFFGVPSLFVYLHCMPVVSPLEQGFVFITTDKTKTRGAGGR